MAVPLLLVDLARTFARFGNLGLGWEKSDHHDDTWRCGTKHKRKETRSQVVAQTRERREQS